MLQLNVILLTSSTLHAHHPITPMVESETQLQFFDCQYRSNPSALVSYISYEGHDDGGESVIAC